MTSIQERLQIKREPLDKWSVREQLCLASAVAKSGDQNWMSVSRALKPFGDPNRPPDWFHQKNCAAQYGSLLENVETPKRKKRISGSESTVETPIETILRKLTRERIEELEKCLMEEKTEYMQLQEDMTLLQSGSVSEELLDKWCKEIDEEEKQKEEETIAHTQWLKERELRKQEIERAWRPLGKPSLSLSQKRKAPDSLDSLMDLEMAEDNQHLQPQETTKPALSPLLTSLLKSPSQAQNAANSSILHSAITSQRSTNTGNNPTIASLLSASTGVLVSPGLQQLVTTAITQEPSIADPISTETLANDILEEAVDSLPNIKVEDLESSMLSSDDPLPEIKNEEVEVIISDLIQNADIVSDPEQHLQLDGNEDIITNLDNELQELCNEEQAAAEEAAKEKIQAEKLAEKPLPKIDPFEFEEDPEICLPKPSSSHSKYQDLPEKQEEALDKPTTSVEAHTRKDSVDESKVKEKHETGSVEIVEVVVMEEAEIDKQLNKTQIQDIVHSIRDSIKTEVETSINTIPEICEAVDTPEEPTEKQSEAVDNPVFDEPSSSIDLEVKSVVDEGNKNEPIDANETSRADTFTPEYSGSFFDDINIEVNKLDKSGKAKRDYSRTKKRESEKDFDILLAVEKAVSAQLEASELAEDTLSDDKDYPESEKKFDALKPKAKTDTDRSSSPWTEEEEMTSSRNRRRYSEQLTPIDSVPNSPASSTAYFEDDRDYRNWKKSVMLVYNRLTTHKYASLFLKPITDDMAPGYHSVVYRPMDLQTIRKNIESGVIRTTLELQRDVVLMFTNAIMYNKTNELVYNMAKQMQQESIQQIQILLQAQQGDTPPRRETRTSEPTKRKRPPEDNVRNKKRKED